MTIDQLSERLSDSRAQKIRIENKFADDIADIEAQIDEDEAALAKAVKADEKGWLTAGEMWQASA